MIRHFTLTLTGSAQRLSSLLPDQTAAPTGTQDGPVREILLQPGGANANAVFVGGDGVTSSDYGVRLAAAAAGVPPTPLALGPFDRPLVRLGDVYVIGTNTETLHVTLLG